MGVLLDKAMNFLLRCASITCVWGVSLRTAPRLALPTAVSQCYGVCFHAANSHCLGLSSLLPWSKRPELTPDVRQAYTRFGATVCVDLTSTAKVPKQYRSWTDR